MTKRAVRPNQGPAEAERDASLTSSTSLLGEDTEVFQMHLLDPNTAKTVTFKNNAFM